MKVNQLRNKELIFSVLRQVTVIILLSFALGLLMNQARSNTLPLVAAWSPETRLTADSRENMVVSLDEARNLCLDKKAIFLDARSSEEYARGHIRCAQNIPWQSFDEFIDRVFETIPDNAWIVTYCDGEHCSLSEDLAKELLSMGYERVKVLPNGWTRWRETGFPTQKAQNASSDNKRRV